MQTSHSCLATVETMGSFATLRTMVLSQLVIFSQQSCWNSGWKPSSYIEDDEPCLGICQNSDYSFSHNPVMSRDGKSCSKCDEDTGKCPRCEEDEQYWCRATQSCNALTLPCNGTCPSHLYPMLKVEEQICQSCDDHFQPSCSKKVDFFNSNLYTLYIKG